MRRVTGARRGAFGGLVAACVLLCAGPGYAAAPTTPAAKISVVSDQMTVSYWAPPASTSAIRSIPSVHGRRVGHLHWLTEDGQEEVYLVLRRDVLPTGRTWLEIDIPERPNGRRGWVPADALGQLQVVYGHLLIDRATLRATLYDRAGKAIFSAPVGVGRSSLPTPAGHFYVREKLRAIGGPVYGPFAIGTSAYAPKLSEWPGGGVVGIHGTNQPQLIPGRPSHGCIRMRNAEITRLWRLIAIGEPIDIV